MDAIKAASGPHHRRRSAESILDALAADACRAVSDHSPSRASDPSCERPTGRCNRPTERTPESAAVPITTEAIIARTVRLLAARPDAEIIVEEIARRLDLGLAGWPGQEGRAQSVAAASAAEVADGIAEFDTLDDLSGFESVAEAGSPTAANPEGQSPTAPAREALPHDPATQTPRPQSQTD